MNSMNIFSDNISQVLHPEKVEHLELVAQPIMVSSSSGVVVVVVGGGGGGGGGCSGGGGVDDCRGNGGGNGSGEVWLLVLSAQSLEISDNKLLEPPYSVSSACVCTCCNLDRRNIVDDT